MKRFWTSMTLVAALALLIACACVPASAATIRGQVLLPNGSPASGITIALYPHTGQALDPINAYWKIPGYDFHRVTTDASGNFVMSGVVDYPENLIHRYVVYCDSPKYYHATYHVTLGGPTQDFNLTVQLKNATILSFDVKDAAGQPINGTRAIYVQSGVLGQGVMKGVSYVVDVDFVNGKGEYGPVVIKDTVNFAGEVAILEFTSTEAAHAALKARSIPFGDTRQPLRYVSKQVDGAAAEAVVTFVPAGYTPVAFTLQ